jgi:hypothetical protein
VQVTVAYTRSNDPEIHAPECGDVKRGLRNGKYQGADTIEVTEVEGAARWFWADFLPEGCAYGEADPPWTDADAQGYTRYLPCTRSLHRAGQALPA